MGHGGTRRDMVRHHETLTCAMRAPGVPAAPTQGRQDSARFRKLSMILVDYYRILKIIIDDIDVYIHIYIYTYKSNCPKHLPVSEMQTIYFASTKKTAV